ncbi:zinc finger protein 813 [Nasonia vitripennis]|uniref:C2H2-type domain-containing protein n=1 Tax=Nasonia vitripennis TaxID=7425 RepID=A0A7M7M649_NASVI|nr:zinc finger protein 813 [Nasonia vitripennis]
MGSLSLTCPMCCGETFNNSESLKYHLLSITDNLYCPGCSIRTYSMAALIQHLDCCGKQEEPEEQQKLREVMTDQTENNENAAEGSNILIHDMPDNDEDTINDSFLATVNEEGIMIVGEGRTIQVDENGDIQVLEKGTPINSQKSNDIDNSIKQDNYEDSETSNLRPEETNLEGNSCTSNMPDTSELLNDNSNEFMEMVDGDMPFENHEMLGIKKEHDQSDEKEQEDAESEVMYSCSTCGMSFASVLDHIKEYHDGQEVVLEMAEQQIDEIAATTAAQNIDESPADANASEETTNNATTKANSSKQRQAMNTLKTEECIDSDGRLYTRKVVQIERFWDRTPVTLSTTKAPMIEKFFSNVEGVKVRDKSVTVAPTRMYRCNQCLEQFAKLSDFRIHVCLQGAHRCDKCEQTFATPKALQIHIKQSHLIDPSEIPSQNLFLCTVCGTEFLTHKSLRLHSRMHAPVRSRHVDAPVGTGEETFDCNECGATLSESYRLAHMALHAGDPITCHVCNRKFDSKESLNMHAAVHLEIPMNSNSGAANSAAMALAAANEMIISTTEDPTDPIFVSTGITPAKTTQVNTMASTSSTVTTTTATTTTTDSAELQNQKPYQCQHCGRRFTRPHEKVKHERIHTGEKPHSCEVCGKKFRVSYCLTLHMRTHTNVRPYECQHCGKRFKASSVYNHHLLTHGEERAYTCPYCPKTFKTRVQLAGHKNSHTKPFRCTECSRPFASLYAARAHIQTHKQDNNLKFSCNICGASYGRAFALKDHVKQHERENTLVPPEATREEEVQEVESFLLPTVEAVEDDELIVPSPPACNDPMDVELVEEV